MSGTARTVAVTGATGFLGHHVVAALARRGWQPRLLARREPSHSLWQGLKPDVVLGSLSDATALARLVDGCDAVVHLAGLIKARDEGDFVRVNRDGTRALAEAVARASPNAHFVQISSLAARAPELSGYASSKRAGEDAALEVLGPSRISVLRPPAIYGPGDRETLTFFKLARQPLIPLPKRPEARFALVHAADAARMIADCAGAGPTGSIRALSDDRPSGYSWREILTIAATAVGNEHPRFLAIPAGLLSGVGDLLGLVARIGGPSGMVNPGKVRELLHEDWAVHPDERWTGSDTEPRKLAPGFLETVGWYRQMGWL